MKIGGLQHDALPVLAQYYGYALVVFALCYSLRTCFRPLGALDFLADVSYPLYAVHALTGYVSLKILMDRGLPFGPAVSLVMVAALALAWLIHVGIETRSSDYGKKLGTLVSRGRVLAAA